MDFTKMAKPSRNTRHKPALDELPPRLPGVTAGKTQTEGVKMKLFLYLIVVFTVLCTHGCLMFNIDSEPTVSEDFQLGEELVQSPEFSGPRIAKGSPIGCNYISDMEIAKKGDFDTIEKLIREGKCFVIPSDTEVFIKKRATDDIVAAKLRESRKTFYTLKGNLVPR